MFTSINPFTGQQLNVFPLLADQDIQLRLDHASEAFWQFWRRLPIEERAVRIQALGEALLAERELLAREMTLEMGKPITQSRAEIDKCAWLCRYAAATAATHLSSRSLAESGVKAAVRHEPLGGLLGIMPWNFPFWQTFRFAVPSLLAGNVVLVKPAPNVAGCSLHMERLFSEAIGKSGVFQTLLIDVPQIEQVIAHPCIAGVALTGSDRAGASVAAVAGSHLKKCVLELGGSDAFVVLDDADIEQAAQTAVASRMNNNGQTCIAAKRLIVHKKIMNPFAEAVLKAVNQLHAGDPLSEKTYLSCLARPDLADHLEYQVHESLRLGAKPLLEGGLVVGSDTRFRPWVLTDIPPTSPAATEELFGPVVCLFAAATEDEAIKIANSTAYGLGAALWTSNVDKASRLAEQIQCGSIAINGMVASDPRLPFGGIKRSGYGRELGPEGFLEFVNTKTVTFQ